MGYLIFNSSPTLFAAKVCLSTIFFDVRQVHHQIALFCIDSTMTVQEQRLSADFYDSSNPIVDALMEI